MSAPMKRVATVAAILGAAGAGLWAGQTGLIKLPLTSMKSMAEPGHPAASGPIIYYRDPDGRPFYSLTSKTTDDGKAYVAVHASEDVSFEEKQAGPDPASTGRKIKYYRNPMGFPDTSPTPKKDSMGMDYIPVYEDEASAPAGTVQVSLDKVQRAGVRTEPVTRKVLTYAVSAVGSVVPNEATLAAITVKFSGFIESLAVPVTGANVRKGEPLMRVWIESPELLQKQVDYLLALKRDDAPDGLRKDKVTAERNLKLFDFPQSGIALLEKERAPVRSLEWIAPVSGTVLEKPAVAGMRFSTGDTLFRIADLSTVWVIADVAERDLWGIRQGQSATLRFRAFPEEPIEGKVAFIYPDINTNTRTAKVRIEVPNPDGRIKLGLYADIAIEAAGSGEKVIAIPQSAVIDNGAKQVVFVAKGEGRFEPRQLKLGRRGDSDVEVKAGLVEGEEIVTTGNFLIDSESNLRAALAAFTADSGPANGGTQ